MRMGALSTRARTTRGRHGNRSHHAGCGMPETNNHVLQICSHTHSVPIARYNSAVNYIGKYIEPYIPTIEGIRKPDIVAIIGTLKVVIDAQVAGEQSDLERAWRLKIKKYARNPDIERVIQHYHGASNIQNYPAILSCKWVWSSQLIHSSSD